MLFQLAFVYKVTAFHMVNKFIILTFQTTALAGYNLHVINHHAYLLPNYLMSINFLIKNYHRPQQKLQGKTCLCIVHKNYRWTVIMIVKSLKRLLNRFKKSVINVLRDNRDTLALLNRIFNKPDTTATATERIVYKL